MLKKVTAAITGIGMATLVAVSFVSAQRSSSVRTLTASDLLEIRGGQWVPPCYRALTDDDLTNDCTGSRQYTIDCTAHGCSWVAPLTYECDEQYGAGSWSGDQNYHNLCPNADEGAPGQVSCGYTFTFCEQFYECEMCDIGTGTPICTTGSHMPDSQPIQKVTVYGDACVGPAPVPSVPWVPEF